MLEVSKPRWGIGVLDSGYLKNMVKWGTIYEIQSSSVISSIGITGRDRLWEVLCYTPKKALNQAILVEMLGFLKSESCSITHLINCDKEKEIREGTKADNVVILGDFNYLCTD